MDENFENLISIDFHVNIDTVYIRLIDASNLVSEFLFSSLFGEGKGRRVWLCILARPIHDEGAINESDTGSYKPPLFVKGEGVDFGKADNEACSTTAPLFPIISLPFSFSSSSSRDMLPISINY